MGTDYDFSGPFLSAAIITDPDDPSARFPLWAFDSEKSQTFIKRAELNGLKALAFLTDLTVKQHLGQVPTITAVLSPPFEAARLLLESNIILYGKSILEVTLGYTSGTPGGAVLATFEGQIWKPDLSIGTDTTITLNAQGTGGMFGVSNTSTKVWEKKSPLDILKEIFARAPRGKLEVDVSELSGDELTELETAKDSENQGGQSDWYFANVLCKRAGCWGLEVGKKFKIISKNAAFSGKPEWKFKLFDFPAGVISAKNGVFPILGFSTPTMAVFLTGAAKSLRAVGTSSATRKEVTEVASDAKSDVASADPKGVGYKTDQPKDTDAHMLPIDASDSDAKKILENEYKTAREGMGVTIEVETLGLPDLLPGQLIQIDGVAKERLDGKYVVMTLEHQIGSSGFTTKFTAVTNTAQLALKTGVEIGPKQSNTQAINEKSPESSLDPKGGTIPVEATAIA